MIKKSITNDNTKMLDEDVSNPSIYRERFDLFNSN